MATKCTHPPTRLYTWTGYDGTLCVACCDCGGVLAGAMPFLPATMACPDCGQRDTSGLTWCGDQLDCECGNRYRPDPWCGACNGHGYVDREYTDWVPYGSTNVPMQSAEREECECCGSCPKCGAEANDGPCPVCGYEIDWDGPDNFETREEDHGE